MKVIVLDPQDVADVAAELARALQTGQSVRMAVDSDAVKVKIGYGSWSPPLGVMEVDD